jgi:hypothetical protein
MKRYEIESVVSRKTYPSVRHPMDKTTAELAQAVTIWRFSRMFQVAIASHQPMSPPDGEGEKLALNDRTSTLRFSLYPTGAVDSIQQPTSPPRTALVAACRG